MHERVGFYAEALGAKWPASVPSVGPDGRLAGMWLLGNNYRNKTTFYGTYPPGYLRRVSAFFPDAESVLHLFSGALPPGDYTRFDFHDERGDVCGNAEELSRHFAPNSFDIIYADPPYSQSDQDRYLPGLRMPNRKKVLHECAKVLMPGGFVVWLDQVMPMFTKREFALVGVIGIVRSTNHRFRLVTVFQRAEFIAGRVDHYSDLVKPPDPNQPRRKVKDKIGRRFGRLTVTAEAPARQRPSGKWVTYWRVRCECGNERDVLSANLTSGKTRSCGCLRMDVLASPNPLSGEYKTYKKNVARQRPTIAFRLTEDEFVELVTAPCVYCGAAPALDVRAGRGLKRGTIDRVDSSGDYESFNCVPACWTCNKMKRDMHVAEFLAHVARITAHRGGAG